MRVAVIGIGGRVGSRLRWSFSESIAEAALKRAAVPVLIVK